MQRQKSHLFGPTPVNLVNLTQLADAAPIYDETEWNDSPLLVAERTAFASLTDAERARFKPVFDFAAEYGMRWCGKLSDGPRDFSAWLTWYAGVIGLEAPVWLTPSYATALLSPTRCNCPDDDVREWPGDLPPRPAKTRTVSVFCDWSALPGKRRWCDSIVASACAAWSAAVAVHFKPSVHEPSAQLSIRWVPVGEMDATNDGTWPDVQYDCRAFDGHRTNIRVCADGPGAYGPETDAAGFFAVVCHGIGHALGLPHDDVRTSCMNPVSVCHPGQLSGLVVPETAYALYSRPLVQPPKYDAAAFTDARIQVIANNEQ